MPLLGQNCNGCMDARMHVHIHVMFVDSVDSFSLAMLRKLMRSIAYRGGRSQTLTKHNSQKAEAITNKRVHGTKVSMNDAVDFWHRVIITKQSSTDVGSVNVGRINSDRAFIILVLQIVSAM